jgi:large subunit ribosomal protein L9
VTKSQIVLDRPIKAIGMHDVKVALHPEVAVTVRVNVARSPEEADLQLQGIDVMAQMFERDAAPPPEELAPEELTPVAATDDAETGEEEAPEAEAPSDDGTPAEERETQA